MPLPPKAKPREITKLTSGFQSSHNLPFTIEEVAKAINVNASSIRRITKESGYTIQFKPSFVANEDKYLSSFHKLKLNDIENFYHNLKLTIEPEGVEDFNSYVKKIADRK